MELIRKKIEIDFPLDYYYIDRGGSKLAILLHGFAQKGEDMLEHFQKVIPEDYDILAPNGPFPLPKIRREYIDKRYAWYFYDRHTNTYDIDYNFPATLLSKIVNETKHSASEKMIIGYSQGGYLAPFVAERLENVSKVIGLACTFKWQFLKEKLNFSLFAIHGSKDNMVEMENSKNHFDKLKERVQNSQYIILDDLGHTLTNEFIEKTVELF
ncbi:hypothetical protein A9Q84_12400 [Halobacteriovorax marinus]|uniref:Phospholipase/carboxylesterase/thioesterase domain-containing protein n=1 Tax=Halobacteriovorax marinus TaxID=97084 RepID=A0A1Y5F8B6_9BACT|nr:hypothetical protein A9Q84_12400 [Halobacteriovorax marinus]